MASINQSRSENHEIYSIKLNKIGLSPYDDKRYILDNGSDNLPQGHCKIKQLTGLCIHNYTFFGVNNYRKIL